MPSSVLQRYFDRLHNFRLADKSTDSSKSGFQAGAGALSSPTPVPPAGTPPSSRSPFSRLSRDVSKSPTGPLSPTPPMYPSPVRPSPRRALQFNTSSRVGKQADSSRNSPSGMGKCITAHKPHSSAPSRTNELIQARKGPSFERPANSQRSIQLGTSSHRLLGPVPALPPPSLLQSAAKPQEMLGQQVSSFRHRRYIVSKSPPPNAPFLTPTPPPADPALPSLEPLTLSHTPSGPSTIRHRSTTPVRVTKDAQLARRQSSRKPSPQGVASNIQRMASSSSTSGTISALPVSSRIASTSASLHCSSRIAPLESAVASAPKPSAHVSSWEASMSKSGEAASTAAEAPVDENSVSASNAAADGEERFVDSLAGYSIGKVIGEGGFCQVKVGVHELSGRSVAVKDAVKTPYDWRRVGREIRILRRLKNHPAIIHMYDVITLPSSVYVIQELAQGGSLLDFVRSRKRIPEDTALRFFLQIVAGLQFCHENEVVHRDIKLENLLLDKEHNMKIIDFGLAAVFTPQTLLKVHCGSPSYAAPEIVSRQSYVGPPVDIWSLGVVTFAMVCGHLPFYSRNGRSELSQKILSGKYHAPDVMSPEFKDLVSTMLVLEPSRRATLAQIWTHPWVTGSLAAASFRLPCPLLPRNGATGEYAYNQAILDYMAGLGVPTKMVVHTLAAKECNHITATYFLLAETLRSSMALPRTAPSIRDLGKHIARRHAAGVVQDHDFSLEVDEEEDRDDTAFFAPPRSKH